MTDTDTDTGDSSTYLSQERSAYLSQLNANPDLKMKMAALMLVEEGDDPTARQALAETIFNRGNAKGWSSVDTVMDPRYYQPMHDNSGNYQKALSRLQSDPTLKNQLLGEIDNVAINGTNYSNYATDNASGWVAKNSATNQTPTWQAGNGEQFFRKDIRPDVHGSANVAKIKDWYQRASGGGSPQPAVAQRQPSPPSQASAYAPSSSSLMDAAGNAFTGIGAGIKYGPAGGVNAAFYGTDYYGRPRSGDDADAPGSVLGTGRRPTIGGNIISRIGQALGLTGSQGSAAPPTVVQPMSARPSYARPGPAAPGPQSIPLPRPRPDTFNAPNEQDTADWPVGPNNAPPQQGNLQDYGQYRQEQDTSTFPANVPPAGSPYDPSTGNATQAAPPPMWSDPAQMQSTMWQMGSLADMSGNYGQ